jgi:hypothetical protein
MDRFGILNSSTQSDEQVLETDIMRFLAIIGIVFWIIFSVIKSIPFQGETTALGTAIQTQPKRLSPPALPEIPMSTPDTSKPSAVVSKPNMQSEIPVTPEVKQQPETLQKEKMRPEFKAQVQSPDQSSQKDKPKAKEPEKKPKRRVTSGMRGIRLEFENLEAIMNLIRKNRLAVYGRAKATGFDLIFLGIPMGDAIRFKTARKIPHEMWEIKEGPARRYFVDLMENSFPSIRTFPEKNIQVAFLDETLDQQVLQKLTRLRENNQNGILSVTANGDLIFNDQGLLDSP